LIKAGFYESAIGENFNLAAGQEIKIKDMMEAVNKTCGNSTPPKFIPRRKWDTKPRLLASIEKANKLIDYKPVEFFDETLQKNMEWFQENWEIIQGQADFPPGMNSALQK